MFYCLLKPCPPAFAHSDAMGCIYVDRARRIKSTLELSSPTSKTALNGADTTSQAGVAALVRRRMEDSAAGRLPGSRPMLLFPEGTTTNGKYLLPFKTGAFLAGLPVKPAILRYETRHMSPAWESIPALRHIILMLCNPVHSVTCYELPVYVPSEDERKDPRLYADNVRKHMVGT
jgi:1-acyl-sn-glycerol-3-phosphate acyltransferase